MAHSDGAQHGSLLGRDAVVMAAEEFTRLTVARTGAVLVQALQASPYPQLDIAPQRQVMPVRTVKL